MPICVAWCITGAGHFMVETFEVMVRLVKEYDVKVTTMLSRAGVEVARMYGIWDKLDLVSPGSYYGEVLTDESEGASAARAGRLLRGKYSAVVVSPASANTVAKIVHGIADTLVTNAVAQANRAGVPVVIVPTDQKPEVVTRAPHFVERDLCTNCGACVAACPYGAIDVVEGKAYISLSECHGCGECARACEYGAVKFGETIKVRARPVDLKNVERLRRMEGFVVLEDPSKILPWLIENLRLQKRAI